MDRAALKRGLQALEGSRSFLVVIMASILLSYWSLHLQQKEIQAILRGEDPERLPSVFPIQLRASAFVIGAQGFFLCLALDRLRGTEGGSDPVERRSAMVNALAAVLVMGAALLRLGDILFVEGSRESQLLLVEDQPPL